ncbi:MAG TPA: hypothetical protein VGD00_09050 [Solirubrobacteraceae bacterium]|jgi:hypothetical protein
MPSPQRRLLPAALPVLCTGLLLLLSAGPAAQARLDLAAAKGKGEATLLSALLRSRELWATIDVCNPADQRNMIGVRGSMPGDRHAGDTMWMSFRLQYPNSVTKKWTDLSSTVTSFVVVGHGGSVRQGGRSFLLVPKAGRAPSTLRGFVNYQWRRGSRVLQSGTRETSAGHSSRAGADPPGFSAATCVIG